MGLLDGPLGNLAGSMLGGQAGNAGGGDLLGGLLGQLGGSHAGGNALVAAAMALVQQHGGLEGIVRKLQSGGLGDVVQSWVGTGANAAVSPGQLEQALGGDAIAQVAQRAGIAPAQASAGLSSILPQLINHLTPEGRVTPQSGDLLSQGLSMLGGMLGKP